MEEPEVRLLPAREINIIIVPVEVRKVMIDLEQHRAPAQD